MPATFSTCQTPSPAFSRRVAAGRLRGELFERAVQKPCETVTAGAARTDRCCFCVVAGGGGGGLGASDAGGGVAGWRCGGAEGGWGGSGGGGRGRRGGGGRGG